MRYDLPLDVAGLAEWLAKHPDIKGIGPAKARKLAQAFGEKFSDTIENRPEEIARVAGLKPEEVSNLQEVWTRESTHNALSTRLAGNGLTHHQVSSLVKKYGNRLAGVLEEDPYLLVREIRGFGFKRVDEIALKLGTPKNHLGRIRAGVLHAMNEALDNEGHTCLDRREVVQRAHELLALDDRDAKEKVEAALEELVFGETLTEIPGESNILVAVREAHVAETRLLKALAEANSQPVERKKDVAAYLREYHAALNDKQHIAAVTALTKRISLISGGAGVGKTFTIQAIVATAQAMGLAVDLAAPTGKAAKRMEQVVGLGAQTIHRLLGYHPVHGFQYNANNPLECDMLILDEVSMVDIYLAKALFDAIDLTRTSVVLVGDHNQLPPVGPGNFLRDIIARGLAPTTILDVVVRQAGLLKENSSAVLKGIVEPTAPGRPGDLRPWYVVNNLTEPARVRDTLLTLIDTKLEILGLDVLRDVQVLSPQHKGDLGCIALNIAIQELVQRKKFGVTVAAVEKGRRPRLYPGDKVIQTRNNYDLGIMNGEIGFVEGIISEGKTAIAFENGVRHEFAQNAEELRSIELAYCLTVHKVQGSEYPCIIGIFHKSHSYSHDRCLLYTAVTRARRTAILLGDHWGIKNCAQKVKSTTRTTMLGQEVLV